PPSGTSMVFVCGSTFACSATMRLNVSKRDELEKVRRCHGPTIEGRVPYPVAHRWHATRASDRDARNPTGRRAAEAFARARGVGARASAYRRFGLPGIPGPKAEARRVARRPAEWKSLAPRERRRAPRAPVVARVRP